MHVIEELQGRVFQLVRRYGMESNEVRAISSLLAVYLPEMETVKPPVSAAHLRAPTKSARRKSANPRRVGIG